VNDDDDNDNDNVNERVMIEQCSLLFNRRRKEEGR
jgi:hypothetical protein